MILCMQITWDNPYIHSYLSRTLKATQKTSGNQKVGQLVKSASLHSLSSGSSGSSSGNSASGSSSLLATISTSPLTTVELISSAACSGLLATRLSGKALHTFQDIILLHEAYDDMSEGGFMFCDLKDQENFIRMIGYTSKNLLS